MIWWIDIEKSPGYAMPTVKVEQVDDFERYFQWAFKIFSTTFTNLKSAHNNSSSFSSYYS